MATEPDEKNYVEEHKQDKQSDEYPEVGLHAHLCWML